jgi:hypothetical protein
MIKKIGIILCAYGNPDYVQPCLEPWIKLKEKYNISIAAVHGQFKEYHENDIIDTDIGTVNELFKFGKEKIIDYLYIQNNYWSINSDDWIFQTEAQIRDKGLQYLLKEECDIIWLLDLDEFYTEEQIENIIKYISASENELITWFSIPMKNYIFSGKEYIKGFCPPRIFKVNNGKYQLYNFYHDNDVFYLDINTINGEWYPHYEKYTSFSYKSVPENIINGGVKHLTWTHENGRLKEMYQRAHFNGTCSYKFNKETEKLEFDYDFYRKNGLDLPIIYKDE